jgi:hypothetical protein
MASCTHSFHVWSCLAVFFAITLALHSGLLVAVLESNVYNVQGFTKCLMWVGPGSTEVKFVLELPR